MPRCKTPILVRSLKLTLSIVSSQMGESYETKLLFSMAQIEYLPIEIISIILENESISITDIIRFMSTCKRLQETTLSNHFWKKKFYQRCPTARKYCAQKPKKTFDYLNFEELIKTGMKHVKKIQYYVSLMSDNNLSATDKKELESFLLYIVGNCKLTYYFVLDEINRSSTQYFLSWSKYGQSLTVKYNLKLIANFLNLYRYAYNNIKHLYKPSINSPLLERLITIIVQYLQPHVSYSVIKMWLDNISLEVLDRLKMKHPEHPIFSTSVEQFLFWKYNNINDHFWNPTETMQIMCELEKYIFSEVDVHKLLQLLKISDLKDKYIDCISEFFSKYLLIAVYHSVARRLGIYCILHPISTVEYFSIEYDLIIIWKQRYNTETGDADYFYIQKVSDLIYPSNIIKGKYHVNITYDLLPKMNDNKWLFEVTYNNMIQYIKDELEYNHKCINYKWQFEMISNILRNIERSTVMHSACFYDDVWIKDYYEQITNVIQVKSDEKQLTKMQEGIKFAVGMIVMYPPRDLHYFDNDSPTYEGVIIGWHDKCEIFSPRGIDMLPFLNDYVHRNFVHEITLNPNEPHYLILAENNAVCYVAEGHLSKCPPKEINNIEIGRFFYRFGDTHYVPNKNLEQKYQYSLQYHTECHVTNFGKCLLGHYVDDWNLPFLDFDNDLCCQVCCSE